LDERVLDEGTGLVEHRAALGDMDMDVVDDQPVTSGDSGVGRGR